MLSVVCVPSLRKRISNPIVFLNWYGRLEVVTIVIVGDDVSCLTYTLCPVADLAAPKHSTKLNHAVRMQLKRPANLNIIHNIKHLLNFTPEFYQYYYNPYFGQRYFSSGLDGSVSMKPQGIVYIINAR